MFARGELVLAAASGDFGKPRPCLVVRSNEFQMSPAVTICPLTSTIRDDLHILRIRVEPTALNGLAKISQIAIDKVMTVKRSRVTVRIGALPDEIMQAVNRSLAVYLGLR